MAEINEAEVMDALHECYDPEIPVNIVDLGLIYGINIDDEAGRVEVKMTLTAMGCPMAGDVISEVEMRDVAGFEAYRTIAAKAIAQYGGRYLVRGGAANAAEGGPPPKTIIVVEFPSMEKLREWYASAEYAEALKVRRTALDRRLIFVEGVLPA